ncbi:hypothetical protein ACFUEJ_09210 [Gordonia sp. NPDC057258]|uniref:hypothetical protein n=1 Tax=unclassified Gordonia (in: high G+C Gram-positive bacteria) TaxID=2657482 RepID=UPI00363FFB6E
MPPEDDEAKTSLEDWIRKLDGLIAKLDEFDGDSPFDFCEHFMDAWRDLISRETAPPPQSAAMVIVLETMRAQAEVLASAAMDYANTPDARDRMTRNDVQNSMRTALQEVAQRARNWLSTKLPTEDEIREIITNSLSVFNKIQEQGEQQIKQDADDDAAAASDPYGAMLGYSDPGIDAAIIFKKLCSFTADEDAEYRTAHERLRRMIDSELLRHISDENERFCDLLIAVISDVTSRRISLSDQDAFDERRRRIRSALISFTSALHSHRDQSIRAVREQFGRKTVEEKQALDLFDDLLVSSFDYRWLIKMRDALLHGDINAFKIELNARLEGESTANVFMDRDYMIKSNRAAREKWIKITELEAIDYDPSVLDMIKAAQPQIAELQDQLDAILYPDIADDVATVKDLVDRFEGKEGLYALQSGLGFTRKVPVPPYILLAPRVLTYASNYAHLPSPSE